LTLLTTGDVLEALPVGVNTLDRWCARGIVQPVGGQGSGNHRQFKPMQVVALAVALRLRRTSGCSLPMAAKVVRRIGAMGQAESEAEFGAGRTHILPIAGLPLEPPRGSADDDIRDVQKVYRHVMDRISVIEDRLQHHVGGRQRGLAGASRDQLVGGETR